MGNTIGIIALELGVAVIFWLLYVVIESAVLQFVNWGDFRTSLRGALLANLVSSWAVALSFVMIRRFGLPGITGGLLVAIPLEGLVLSRLKPEAKTLGWFAAIAANLISFIILTIPVYWFSKG
jgi:hypothetical protein